MIHNRNGQVRSIDIANELEFSKPSVSVAMKKLRENGFIEVDDDGYITLTEPGLDIAGSVYERHILLNKCLLALGVDEATAAHDACNMEHVISQQTFERIRDYYQKNLEVR